MTAVRSTLWRLLTGLAVAWLIVGSAVWLLGSVTSRDAALTAVLLSVLLGLAVWWLSGRLRIPSRLGAGFLAAHALLAVLAAAGIIGLTYAMEAYATSRAWRDVLRGSSLVGVEFIFWMWLYALVAAGSYGVRFQDTIRRERERAAEARAAAVEARLTALRGQLNPHFLFNALHGLAALVRRDPALAEQAIERLGDLLRYSLDEGRGAVVRLEEEWRFVESYVALERLGGVDDIALDAVIPDDLLELTVPPFAVQTLVENAIRHGLVPGRGGTIRVRASRQAKILSIEVADDGVRPESARAPGTGTGLQNLRDRLEALHGPAASLALTAGSDGGIVATLVVPCR